jgi:hypothetical protein
LERQRSHGLAVDLREADLARSRLLLDPVAQVVGEEARRPLAQSTCRLPLGRLDQNV